MPPEAKPLWRIFGDRRSVSGGSGLVGRLLIAVPAAAAAAALRLLVSHDYACALLLRPAQAYR